MALANDSMEQIHQNLIDAGCDAATVKECMQMVSENRLVDMLPTLAKHRSTLLETIRGEQKQLDRLDYLVYQIRRSSAS